MVQFGYSYYDMNDFRYGDIIEHQMLNVRDMADSHEEIFDVSLNK